MTFTLEKLDKLNKHLAGSGMPEAERIQWIARHIDTYMPEAKRDLRLDMKRARPRWHDLYEAQWVEPEVVRDRTRPATKILDQAFNYNPEPIFPAKKGRGV